MNRRQALMALMAGSCMAGGPLTARATCAPSVAPSRTRRMQAALVDGYGVQYWGDGFDPETLAAAPHGLLILEPARLGAGDTPDGREVFFTPDDIARIRGQGRPVLLYLNLTEIEPWRDYRDRTGARPAIDGPTLGPDEQLARWWDPAWRTALMDRIDRMMALGADGLFLDDALHYYTTGALDDAGDGAPRSVPEAATVLMSLVIAITDHLRARDCDRLVVVNNAVFVGRDAGTGYQELFDRYRTAIDAVLVESGLGVANHPDLHLALQEDYLDHGLPVLTIDTAAPNEAAALATRAFQMGYSPYIVPEMGYSSLSINRGR